MAALTTILSEYPASVVDYAADPRTGVITKFPRGLPGVGEIRQFLDDLQTQQARMVRYASLPKAKPRVQEPPRVTPNLFVPETAPRYAQMLKRREQDKLGHSEFGKGSAGQPGLWVPLSWWDGPQQKEMQAFQDAAKNAFRRECFEEGVAAE